MPYDYGYYHPTGMDKRTIYETPVSGARYSEKGNLVVENHVTGRETVYTKDGRVINEQDAREKYDNYRPYYPVRRYDDNRRPSVTIRF